MRPGNHTEVHVVTAGSGPAGATDRTAPRGHATTSALDRATTSALVRTAALTLAVALLAAFLVTLRPASASAADTLLSARRTATASASDSAGRAPAKAFDDDSSTQWSMTGSGTQWLRVDLGRAATLTRMTIRWGTASATEYRMQVSTDGRAWQAASIVKTGRGGVVRADWSGTARYVRMLAARPATSAGYAVKELQVYGLPAGTTAPVPTTGVHVTGTQGAWQLTVDGRPWTIKGVTYGPPTADAAKYMSDIAGMGVNTVRTWGTDASSATLFDAAAAKGVRVVAGLWLNHDVDYVNDATYKADTLASIRSTVTTYRDDPGVLMWDVGNEVMLGQSEAQRVAYAKYVEQVVRAIHAVDPDHPVTSTDAWTGAWTYLRQYTPSLDLYAVNTYGGVGAVQRDWQAGGYTKPYVITETGPAGSWEVPKDGNGIPQQPSDTAAAQAYTDAWHAVTAAPGVALGATMFHYGIEDDEPGVWLNLRTAGLKRLSYYAVERAYRGSVDANTPPVVQRISVSASAVSPGAALTVTAPAVDPDGDTVSYRVAVTSNYIPGGSNAMRTAASSGSGGTLRFTAPTTTGVWKIAVYATDGHGNVGIETTSVKVR